MVRAARKELALRAAETAMIRDTIETDIPARRGFHLVLGGGTRREGLARYAFRPELVCGRAN